MGCKVNIIPLIALLALILLTNPPQSNANLQRLLRRQSEQESTAAAGVNNDHGHSQANHQQQPPARLYPDLPRQPPFLAPNFASGPTPFVPFGPQPMGHSQMMQQPRPMMPADRLQSQTFTSGLGKRLLSMVGIESSSEINANDTATAGAVGESMQMPAGNDMMRALSNSTVLQQLNTGLQSVYGGLSKMYNSTVQQQLEMLRNSFKREAENSTNSWQQRMAQQVPQFFQRMALKVSEAQQNLNQVMHQMMEMRHQNGSQVEPQTRQALSGQLGNNQFFGLNEGNFFGNNQQMGGNFFNQLGNTFGFGQPQDGQQPRDVGSQLMDFWQHQVQPQLIMIRGTVGRVWRDLTQSGALNPMIRSQQSQNTYQPTGANEGAPSELVDNILKEASMASTEYKLVDPVPDSGQQPRNHMGSQMQTRLMSMQRELNQLWDGLSNSLQNALGNVRRSLNPNPQFGPANLATNDNANINKDIVDQAANEISARIKDLNKVQKDADVVYDVVQQQQQQQEQRPTFVDRFRNFIGKMDLEHMDQFSNRVGEQVMRFGNAVGDIWLQLPDRWNNFMQNIGQQESVARLTKPAASSTISTTKKPEVVATN